VHATATHSRHPPPPRPPVLRGRAGAGERGSGTIQLVVLMPLLFTLLFAGVQGAMFYHARTVAIAAAQEGARAAAAQDGTTSAGHAAAASPRTRAAVAGRRPRPCCAANKPRP